MLAEKIEENKLYLLQSSNPDSIFNRMYVTVQNFSEQLQYDLIEQCNKFSYSFENMLNGVDVKVSFDNQKNFVIEPMMLSASPCLLKKIAPYDEHILKQKIPKSQVQKPEIKNEFEKLNVMTEMEKYFSIAQKMVQLRKYKNKENIDKMSNEDKNKLINELNEYSKAMQIILVYIEENEMWENIDEAASISSEIDEILKMLNTK
jgi:adenylate kinase family enzyme